MFDSFIPEFVVGETYKLRDFNGLVEYLNDVSPNASWLPDYIVNSGNTITPIFVDEWGATYGFNFGDGTGSSVYLYGYATVFFDIPSENESNMMYAEVIDFKSNVAKSIQVGICWVIKMIDKGVLYDLVDFDGLVDYLKDNEVIYLNWLPSYIVKMGNTIVPINIDQFGDLMAIKFGDGSILSGKIDKDIIKFFKPFDECFIPADFLSVNPKGFSLSVSCMPEVFSSELKAEPSGIEFPMSASFCCMLWNFDKYFL